MDLFSKAGYTLERMGRKKVEKIPNRLAYMRVRRGMSIGMLSQLTGYPTTTLHRLEQGQPIDDRYMAKLCEVLKCKPDELREPIEEAPALYIVGLIKTKSFVTLLPKKEWRETQGVEGMSKEMKVLRVVGDVLKPHHGKNNLLYYHEQPEKNSKMFVERECLVELPDGKSILCWVSPGSKKGCYTLYPYASMSVMYDQAVQAAYPILHVERR